MKILHTADWHIGRKLNGYSLLKEQEDAFQQLVKVALQEKVEAIVIAGDLYDRSIPSVEAVQSLQEMLKVLNLEHQLPVFAISGNHDSPIRLEAGAPWMVSQQFYLNTRIEQAVRPYELGDVQFFLLPYFEPFHARTYFNDESIREIQTGVNRVVEEMKKHFNPSKRQVLVTHFFVAGATKEESETTLTVGGLANVSQESLADFDYVALGHLHYQNAIKKGQRIKYSGSLLKYSLGEANQEKGFRIVELGTKESGEIKSTFIPVKPLHNVQKIQGKFREICDPTHFKQTDREAYTGVVLEDLTVMDNAIGELRAIYPRLISLELQGAMDQSVTAIDLTEAELTDLNPRDLIQNYYEETVGISLTKQQEEWLHEAILKQMSES
ncbi:exonuclease SbcCD subunit D [Vagococcus sp.]|uniref:exonuclease SbcCD subunit D n=1 Tax=Vagococcus sp. TaxID=1933889 RepID=UPI003F952359